MKKLLIILFILIGAFACGQETINYGDTQTVMWNDDLIDTDGLPRKITNLIDDIYPN